MILDHLENAGKYTALNPHFATAFSVLKRTNLVCLPPGRMEIDGEDVFAMVVRGKGKSPENALLETHDRYIDVHYVLEGTDQIGWKPRTSLGPVAKATQGDTAFYADEPDTWTLLKPGMFAIYFPEDAHMPMISSGEICKVVIKVAV